MKTQVIVFDDNSSRRNSLEILINQEENLFCAGTFEDCSEVLDNIEDTSPDVILMDIDMPKVNGINGVKIIREKYPKLCIIMQTVFEDDDKILDAISAGANGYILKKANPAKIIEAINEVINGGAPMTGSIAKRVLELFNKKTSSTIDPSYKLTDREKEILAALVKGLSYKMVAEACSISVYTVNAHIRNIYEKLQVHSVSEAVRKAYEHKII